MAKIPSTNIELSEIGSQFPSNYQSQGDQAPHEMSEFYGAAADVPTSGEISLGDFAGKEGLFVLTVTENWLSVPSLAVSVSTRATTAGWDGLVPIKLVVPAGKYIYSGDNGVSALRTGTIPRGLIIENNGYIMGCGGRGWDTSLGAATAGGTAITLECNTLLINNGYVAGGGGGGGGGGSYSGGGGGAGGGQGGRGRGAAGPSAGGSPGQKGAKGSPVNGGTGGTGGSAGGGGPKGYSISKNPDAGGTGGGGGRILPGSTTSSAGGNGGGPGQVGGAGAAYTGAGGGGWGAAGGNGHDSTLGGAGGIGIKRNGYTLVVSTGSERIYGGIVA